MSALKDELLMYPRGKHDDLLDGLYYAMLNLYKPYIDTVDSFINQEDQVSQKSYDWAVL